MTQAYFQNTNWIPRLRTYEEAKKHYDKAKPIRGSNVIPIGLDAKSRRRGNCQIFYRDEYIAYLLEAKPVAKYYPDDRIVLNTFDKGDTCMAQFMQALLPGTKFTSKERVVVCQLQVATDDQGSVVKKYSVGDNFVIRYEANSGSYEVLEYQPSYKHRLKRQTMKDIREKYEEFTAYVTTMASLITDIKNLVGTNRIHDAQIAELMGSNQPEDWYCAAANIIRKTARTSYEYGTGWQHTPNPRAAARYIDDLVKHTHHKELFERVQLEEGKYVTDTNRQYIGGLYYG